MRYCSLDLESHVVIHLFLDTSPVGKDENHIHNHKYDYDSNQHLGGNNIGPRLGLSDLDVLGCIIVKADLWFFNEIGTDIFKDVLSGDVASERHVVQSDHGPVHGSELDPFLRIFVQDSVVAGFTGAFE